MTFTGGDLQNIMTTVIWSSGEMQQNAAPNWTFAGLGLNTRELWDYVE